MSTILDAPVSLGSRRVRVNRIRSDVMENGETRGRVLAKNPAFLFTVLWNSRPYSDVLVVDNFFKTNRALVFTFTWSLEYEGQPNQYKSVFRSAPKFTPSSYGKWDIELSIRGRIV
jgi:hypothetical protein